MADVAPEVGRRSGWRRAALYLGGILGPFGGGMVVVLIPEFRDAFDVTSSTASLSITLYLVPFAALQLVSGTIGERYDRERVLRIAFFVYAAASAMTAVVGSIELFLLGRALQGAANAFTTPLILAALAEATDEKVIGPDDGHVRVGPHGGDGDVAADRRRGGSDRLPVRVRRRGDRRDRSGRDRSARASSAVERRTAPAARRADADVGLAVVGLVLLLRVDGRLRGHRLAAGRGRVRRRTGCPRRDACRLRAGGDADRPTSPGSSPTGLATGR